MEPLKYKAKIIKKDEWVTGYPFKIGDKIYMITDEYGYHISKLATRQGIYVGYGLFIKIDPETLEVYRGS